MKVGIIGQGYVGLSLAISAAKAGHTVIGYDSNTNLVNQLETGVIKNNIDSDQVLLELISNKKYLPTNNPKDLALCNIIVIAVPTPLDEKRNPDISFIYQACKVIAENITSEILVVNESTSYPGTLRNIISKRIFELSSIEHLYASSPERIDPGNNAWNLSNTPRLIGGLNEISLKAAADFYSTFADKIILVSSAEVAEMAKLVENSFRQINIAFVNELSQISRAMNLNIYEILEASATKPFGFMKFLPGPGVGGHCIPIDPTYLAHKAKEVGVPSKFIETANEINSNMPKYIVSEIIKSFKGNIADKKVLIIGVTYKKNVVDTRESPAEKIYQLFKSKNISVDWHDPLVEEWQNSKSSDFGNYDIGVVAVLHDAINRESIKKLPFVFDCTGELDWAFRL
jgi:UDP-N-acetyl-D-glucosamine dehydrogenase